jgi:hypothetical protein
MGAMGMPGVHAMFAGTEWEWFLPIRVNDRITSSVYLSDLIEKESEFAKRTVLQAWTTVYRNQDNETISTCKQWVIRTERDTARERGKYDRLTPHHYTDDEIKAIEADYGREEIRGANPRYWEEVQVGEELTPVLKGPLTVTDIIAWKIGWGNPPFVRAHRIGLDYRQRHPAAGIPNSFGIPDVPERVHWDSEYAREVGVPAAYDYGPQRISWLSHLMTNWIGDDGFLRRLYVEVRRFNLMGDTTWCKGRVTKKYVKDGEHLVGCEIWAEDQRGEVTAPGEATVILPSRSDGPVRLPAKRWQI